MTLPDNVITYIADRVTTNVRDLEGALTRLLAFSSLKQVEPSVEIASKVLADAFSVEKRQVTIDLIQQKSAEHFQVEPAMMHAKKKTAEVVIARQVAMYLSRQLTDSSLKAIGTAFGGRDHSTVIHACDTVSSKMSSNPTFRERVDKISASILY